MRQSRIFEVGERFGQLTVVEERRPPAPNVVCVCDCGIQTTARATYLARGLIVSCGCIGRKERELVTRAASARRRELQVLDGPGFVAGHGRITEPLGPRRGQGRPVAEGWRAGCKCGWEQSPFKTRLEAEAAFRQHRTTAAPVCSHCRERKNVTDMSTAATHLCKACNSAKTRAWAKANPKEWERCKRKSYLKRKYGITPEEADALLDAQGGVCAVCGIRSKDSRGFRPHIDHCHKTGKVRGILCGLCNQGLGGLRDDPEIVRRALAYLLAHQSNEVRTG